MTIEKVIEDWDGALSCSRFDARTGAFFTIAIHSQARGPAAGGTRAMVYADPADAVEDSTRLAGAMTLKMAVAGLPMGGGKSVISLPRPRSALSVADWRRILDLHAENLRAFNGGYWTGPDVGTTADDMDILHVGSGFAFGRTTQAGGPGSSAPATAHGVFVSILATVREAGIAGLDGARVVIQGLGAVGMDVLHRCLAAGAHVTATDVDPARCDAARAAGATVISADDVLTVPSDVFVPCAVGGVIDEQVARTLDTRAVAGAANNVLRDVAADDALAERGIVLAPDFVANGGGAIHLVGREVLGWGEDEVCRKVEAIDGTLQAVFALAKERGIGTERAARELARARLVESAGA